MSDQTLAKQALAELQQTTVGFINKNWSVPPIGSHWANAIAALNLIIGGTPPPPPSNGVQLPVGPFQDHTTSVWYRSASQPVTVNGLYIHDIKGKNDGLGIMQWPPKLSTAPYTVSNVITQNIGDLPPSSDGTAEAGIWLGQQVNADRLVCDGTWEGLWTGAMCADSVISNFTVGKKDSSGGYTIPVNHIGLYCEHFTRRTLFQNFDVHSTDNGINVEWWYADSTYAPFVHNEYPQALAGKAGSCHLTFDTGRIYCPAGRTGLFMDAGTFGCTVRNVTFYGPGDAIGLPNNLAAPVDNIVESSCVFQNTGRKVYHHDNKIG